MNRGAWQATVHRVLKSQAQLNMHAGRELRSCSCAVGHTYTHTHIYIYVYINYIFMYSSFTGIKAPHPGGG